MAHQCQRKNVSRLGARVQGQKPLVEPLLRAAEWGGEDQDRERRGYEEPGDAGGSQEKAGGRREKTLTGPRVPPKAKTGHDGAGATRHDQPGRKTR